MQHRKNDLLGEQPVRDEGPRPAAPDVHLRGEGGERRQVDDGGGRRILDRRGGRRRRRRVRGGERRVTGRAQALRVLAEGLAHPVVRVIITVVVIVIVPSSPASSITRARPTRLSRRGSVLLSSWVRVCVLVFVVVVVCVVWMYPDFVHWECCRGGGCRCICTLGYLYCQLICMLRIKITISHLLLRYKNNIWNRRPRFRAVLKVVTSRDRTHYALSKEIWMLFVKICSISNEALLRFYF